MTSRRESSDVSSSPKLRRQSHLMKTSSSEIDEQVTWQNLPKEVWKPAAEVNNQN